MRKKTGERLMASMCCGFFGAVVAGGGVVATGCFPLVLAAMGFGWLIGLAVPFAVRRD